MASETFLEFSPVLGQPGLWSFPDEINNFEKIEVIASDYTPLLKDNFTVEIYARDHILKPEHLSLLGYDGFTAQDIPMLYKLASLAEQVSDAPSITDILANYSRTESFAAFDNTTPGNDNDNQRFWQWAKSNSDDGSVEFPSSFENNKDFITKDDLSEFVAQIDYQLLSAADDKLFCHKELIAETKDSLNSMTAPDVSMPSADTLAVVLDATVDLDAFQWLYDSSSLNDWH